MESSDKSFGSLFEKYLLKCDIKFEILTTSRYSTRFRLFQPISSCDLEHSQIKIPYWQFNYYDDHSFVFVVYENF